MSRELVDVYKRQIIGLASVDIRAGKKLSDKEHDRLLKAVGNVRDAYAKTK